MARIAIVLLAVAAAVTACGGSTVDRDAGRYGTWAWRDGVWSQIGASTETVAGYTHFEYLFYWEEIGGLVDSDGTRWNGTKWIANDAYLAPPPGEAASWLDQFGAAALVADATRHELVFVDSNARTIWGWSSGQWRQLAAVGTWPTARHLRGAVYDPYRQEIILLTCCNPGELGEETWVWRGHDLTREAQLSDGIGGPYISVPPAGQLDLVPDGNGHILAFGSVTYSWDGQAWSSLGAESSIPESAAVLYDPSEQAVIGIAEPADVHKFHTWRWVHGGWHMVVTSSAPPSNGFMTNLVYDPKMSALVLKDLKADWSILP